MSSVKKIFRIVAIVCFGLLAAWSLYNGASNLFRYFRLYFRYRESSILVNVWTLLLGILYLILFLLGVIQRQKAPIIAACMTVILWKGTSILSNLNAVNRGGYVSDTVFIAAGLYVGAMVILLIFTAANQTLPGGVLAGLLVAAQALTSFFLEKEVFLKQFADWSVMSRTTWIARNALTVLGFIALGIGLHRELIKREKTVRQAAPVFAPVQSKADRLLRLKDLLDKEAINPEDFETKKNEILK